jgi:hypothetical protein
MKSPEVASTGEGREFEPRETLQYAEQTAMRLAQISKDIQGMIDEAAERGIPIDLSNNEALNKFKPNGEYESMLLELQSQLTTIKTDLFYQGVKMTEDDMEKRSKRLDAERNKDMPKSTEEDQLEILRKNPKILEQFMKDTIASHPEYEAFKDPNYCDEGLFTDENGRHYIQMACRCKDGELRALRATFLNTPNVSSNGGLIEYSSKEFTDEFPF